MAKGKRSHPVERADRPNTLGLRDRDLSTLVSSLDGSGGDGGLERLHARWPFPNVSVPARLLHPGGNEVELRLACRNLSRGGIGLFHSSFMHPGSRVAVYLPQKDGGERRIEGAVARCLHREGIVHEIGVRFDEEINVRDYIRPDVFEGWLSYERVEPGELSGSLLHVEPEAMDQKILRHFLRETNVRVRTVGSAAEALEVASSGVDLILSEIELPDSSGFEMIGRLRGQSVRTPVVLTTSDVTREVRGQIRFSGASAFLSKPFSNRTMLLAAAEFLLGAPEAVVAPSKAGGDLSGAYALKLAEYAEELDELVSADRPIDAYVICVQMKGTAPALGFEAIGQRAAWLANRIASGVKLGEVRAELSELTMACRKLKTA